MIGSMSVIPIGIKITVKIRTMHDKINLSRFVIPGVIKLALACPVLDTGYLIRGNPVFENWFPAFAGTMSGFPLEFIPVKIGAGMTPCNGNGWEYGEKITISRRTKKLP
jgi:hypothetical protein